MTVCPDKDVAAVQYRVSDPVHSAIAVAGGSTTTPDLTVVDDESAVRGDDALEWTALHMPIPDRTSLDDETLARTVAIAGALAAMDDDTGCTLHYPTGRLTGEPVAVAREVLEYGIFVVRANRRGWEPVLGEATGWSPFEGHRRIVEHRLLVHSRHWIAGQLEVNGYVLLAADEVITLLRSEAQRSGRRTLGPANRTCRSGRPSATRPDTFMFRTSCSNPVESSLKAGHTPEIPQ